jgi:hypothetical protein
MTSLNVILVGFEWNNVLQRCIIGLILNRIISKKEVKSNDFLDFILRCEDAESCPQSFRTTDDVKVVRCRGSHITTYIDDRLRDGGVIASLSRRPRLNPPPPPKRNIPVFLIPFYLQAVHVHLANGVNLRKA